MVKDSSTEKRIVEAARRVFLKKGMAGARMQEIADEAGINKALLHYYFRNKEKLFEQIFGEVVLKISDGLKKIFESDMSVLERLTSIVDIYTDTLLENRYLPFFVLNEMNRNPEKFAKLFEQQIVVHMKKLFIEIQMEVERGKIKKINPAHLLLNILALIIFPFAAYPVMQKIAPDEFKPFFNNFLEDRKHEVKQFIIHALTP